jgi:hypothetical protein
MSESETPKGPDPSAGGKARAKKLTAAEREEIARRAADARWNIPRATHGSSDHPLKIGGVEIPCYVLEDGRRVITNQGVQIGLKMAKSGGHQRTVDLVSALERKGLDCKDLLKSISNPILFRPGPKGRAYGYEATVLADLCDLILDAREKKLLHHQQEPLAAQCEILVRAFARVGIIALIDEATGYQEVRDRRALQAILDRYLLQQFAAWAKRFPNEFYREMFRLRGWQWEGMNPAGGPRCVAQYTKDLVYSRLAPGILRELEARNPVQPSGRRRAAHHQWLTEGVGHPALAQHLHAVIGLMRASPSWDFFMRMLDRAFPKQGQSVQLLLFDDDPPNESEPPSSQSPTAR